MEKGRARRIKLLFSRKFIRCLRIYGRMRGKFKEFKFGLIMKRKRGILTGLREDIRILSFWIIAHF